MQEEVENRTLTLVVSGTKFTGRLLKAAISKYMAHCKEKKLQKQRSRDAPVTPHGKQTVKQLIGQNQGISNIEITDPSIKEFEKIPAAGTVMGGRKGNPYPAFQTFITGIDTPFAEGGTALLRCSSLRFFFLSVSLSFACPCRII